MTHVRYQVVFSAETDYKQKVFEILKEVCEENYDELDSAALTRQINFQYNKKLGTGKILVGFEIDFSFIGSEADQIINDFSSNLQDLEVVELVLKFNDEQLLNFIITMHKDLFGLEMKLREVISYIFIDTYESNYYNFLKDLNLKARFDGYKNLHKDVTQREDFLRKRYENEFFHILFDDYIKLTNPRKLEQDDLFVITEISDNFEAFKKHILERGITKKEYKSFIDDVGITIIPITNIRNCIAHNRMLDPEDIENYPIYFEQAHKKIDEFLKTVEINSQS